MEFPVDYLTFYKWKAFLGNFPEDAGKHRIIIIQETNPLKYFYVTSQVEKCKDILRYDPLALAEVSKNDWGDLTKNSCIQCGKQHLYSVDVDKLREEYEGGRLKVLGEIPEIVKQRICVAIDGSITYNESEKNILKK